MNHRIRVPQVRVINPDGSQAGVMDTRDAMAKAQELELDLVEINPNERPPICKIMDYGKYKYDQSKKARESKKSRVIQETKEVKFGPKIGDHDFNFKLKHIRGFIEDGHKVRMLVRFRGREIVHPETGQAILDRVCQELAEIITVVQISQMENRQMSMVLGPNKKTMQKIKEAS